MSTADTWLIDGTDIHTLADIADFTGVLGEPPAGGELVERDFIPGGVWITAPPGPYVYDVELIMDSDAEDEALGQLAALQALVGGVRTFTRKVTRGSSQVTETHSGVLLNVVPAWDLTGSRNLIRVVATVQNLSGGWS